MELELVHYKDKMLKEPCLTFDFNNPPFDPIKYAKEIIPFMYKKNGVGISANQIGNNYAVFAMRGYPENFVCFNPRIVDASTEETVLEEGCLSYPGLIIKIKRPKVIKVRFNTPNGDIKTEKYIGMTARIFQHEMQHMNGRPFWENCNRYSFEKGVKKSKLQGIVYSGA